MKKIALLMVLSFLVTGTASAAKGGSSTTNQGATPNGQPFNYINEQLEAHTSAISGLQLQVDDIVGQIGVINLEIDDLEESVNNNTDAITETQENLNTTKINLADFRTEVTADITGLQGQIGNLQSQIDGLQAQITNLTATLAVQLISLQDAVDGNTANVGSLSIQITSLTAQILVLNSAVIGPESRLTALEEELEQLQILVAQLDNRLISVENAGHYHGLPASCREILDKNASATSGTYQIDPDADGELESMEVYCDMDNFEGGWTNLNFTTNQVLLENGNLINCSTLSQDDDSITCTSPLFNNDEGPGKKYLYHYYCVGTDPGIQPHSGDYLVDHVGVIVGHRSSPTLGFSSQSNRQTGVHGSSDSNNPEHCYVDGEVVEWSDARCATYNTRGNGNCVPGVFTLTL